MKNGTFFTLEWNVSIIKNCILKSLIDLGSSIAFDEEELNMIHNFS
jgi:hypothetical protein